MKLLRSEAKVHCQATLKNFVLIQCKTSSIRRKVFRDHLLRKKLNGASQTSFKGHGGKFVKWKLSKVGHNGLVATYLFCAVYSQLFRHQQYIAEYLLRRITCGWVVVRLTLTHSRSFR